MEIIKNIKKILYIGSSLNIQIVRDFPNVKKFVFIDNQPRSKSNRYYFSQRDYNDKFIDQLKNITKDYGFDLKKIFILDENYYNKILKLNKKIYYHFFTLPLNINPELYIFENPNTGQLIKYYISTSIVDNMNYSLFCDLKNSDGLLLNKYIPTKKEIDYLEDMNVLIGYINTNFSDCENHKISDKFKNFLLLDEDGIFLKECKSFIDLIIQKINIINN
jgi:hypothetical protein